MTGPFETDVYEVEIEIAGHAFKANCGALPDKLSPLITGVTGIEWIIGIERARLVLTSGTTGCLSAGNPREPHSFN